MAGSRWAEGGLRGWKLLIAVAGGIVAVTGAIKAVAELWPNQVAAEASFARADVGSTIPWDEFTVRQQTAQGRSVPVVHIASGGAAISLVLLAQVGGSETSPPGSTTEVPTDSTPAEPTPTDTNSTDTTSTGTTPTDATSTQTEPAQPPPGVNVPGPPIDPVEGHEPAPSPVELTQPQRRVVRRLHKRVRRRVRLPRGCERSMTARSCPAAVDLGAMPGPAGTAQGTLDRYPYVDQRNVLRYLLRTLPLVRYTKSGHRRVPVGIDVLVRLNLKGSSDRRFYLQWSVYPRGAGGGRLLTWERNRIADVVKASGSTHLTHFWVPIPVQRHGYALHLRVLDEHGRAHDEQDASPSFH